MKRPLHAILVALLWVLMAPMASGQQDRDGSKEYPGLSRMPGYYIEDYRESQFDSFTFTVMENGKEKQVPVEGRTYRYRYDRGKDAPPLSDLQVIRNFQNAARSAGGQVLRDVGTLDRETTLRFAKSDREVWVAIGTRAHGNLYMMIVVEKQVMKQEITMDAAAMASSIANTGSVAIYGIFFDTAKSNLKPESGPAIAEIAKLLAGKPTLKVYIVGHTDMVGEANTNQMLSQARAQSVINELITKHGISDARLTARGVGPYAPVGSNKTEEGRAKNRRVELVEIATK